MKTFINATRIPVLFLLVMILSLTTCKKDDKDKLYRLKSVTDYFNGMYSGGTQIIYDGERVWQMKSSGVGGDSSRVEYAYPEDNKAVESYFDYNGFSWGLSEKAEYTFQGDNISQIIYYGEFSRNAGALDPFMKISMQYQDDNLMEELISLYYEGIWFELAKLTYTYSGDKLTQTMMYNNFTGIWEISYKEDVTYSGDNMDLVVQSDYLEGIYTESRKYEFSYQADRISAIVVSQKADGTTWIIEYQEAYTYDEEGNLASASYIESGNTDKSDFTYEEKKGNLRQFIYRGGGAASIVMPVPTKATMKSFKEVEKYITSIKD